MDVEEITQLLTAAAAGDSAAVDQVFESVYPRLRQLAKSRRRNWHGESTLNTTSLIHEVYLKVGSGSGIKSRGHFFALAAKAMRQILINHAEKNNAQKRGGKSDPLSLSHAENVAMEASEDLLALNEALAGLENLSPRQGKVVECLFFAGYGIDETAEALEISPATVKRDWTSARAWLFREMQRGLPPSPAES